MNRWHTHFLGRQELPHDLTAFELQQFFTFSGTEKAAIMARRTERLRLGAALQLGFMKLSGRPLESVDTVSVSLLEHLGQTLGIDVPHLASLKTLYRRRPTMFAHQKWAREMLGFRDYTERRQRVLNTYLREQAQHRETSEELVMDANTWLYERKVLIPGSRRILNLARAALLGIANDHAKAVRAEVPADVLVRWDRSLIRQHAGRSRLEWLTERPRRLSRKGMRELVDKIEFLRRLGVHKYSLEAIRIDRQRSYARGARRRRPARLMELPDDTRAITVACFLRVCLLELTDAALGQFEMRAARLVSRASDAAQENQRQISIDARACLEQIRQLVEDDSLKGEDLREQIRSILPLEDLVGSHASEVRKVLCEDGRRVRPLLKDVLAVPLQHGTQEPIGKVVKRLKRFYRTGKTSLPRNEQSQFGPLWEEKLAVTDRRQALRAYEAAALEDLRRSLRRGTVWSNESLRYREHESSLIPKDDWKHSKARHQRNLGVPVKAKAFVEKIEAAIDVGLASVASAVESGDLEIRGDELRLPALKPELSELDTRIEFFEQLASTDLPRIIVEIDSQIRFSWTLLGRPAHNTQELLAIYAALLGHGTDLSLASVDLLVPGISRESVGNLMKTLENPSRLRRANSAVVEFLRSHPIAETWGNGATASSDAMSLEASRHLWNARVDPRRRKHAMGMYTHVLDQWGIVYDQPIVLNQRQVGAAIEGVVRSTAAPDIELLAVDTHGYTDFGMAISKLLGFDLCPRLRNLKHRRLYVTRNCSVPKSIRAICRNKVSTASIVSQWDALVRLAASIREGHTSAVHALARYGSAARGDATYLAGVSLGRLQRTLFLSDYFANETFRRELLRILNHGESIHSLQRAIHRGGIGVRRERHEAELLATSGSLSLLTNIVMAWVTQRMQSILDDWHKHGRVLSASELRALKHTSPLHFEGINFRGVMNFPVEQHAARLVQSRTIRLV